MFRRRQLTQPSKLYARSRSEKFLLGKVEREPLENLNGYGLLKQNISLQIF